MDRAVHSRRSGDRTERVAITGAAGNVGTQARKALTDHDVRNITHRERDIDSTVLDLEDVEALTEAFSDRTVVVHMAANPSPRAEWDDLLETNVDGTKNVFEAAVEADVERVIFGSSNHAQHMYNVTDPEKTGETKADARPVSPDDPFRPTTFYGVSKVTGEALGSYYADRYGLEVINQRIGWLMPEEGLRSQQEKSEGRARHARSLWLSHRDCRNAMIRSVEADISENPLTVNVLSRNQERYFTITKALRELDYRPKDDSAEALADSAE